MKLTLCLCFLLLLSSTVALMAQDLSGIWRGKLYQEAGGLYREYDFELRLTQRGSLIQGTSHIKANGQHAQIQLEGTFNGSFFEFREIEILDQKIRKDATWCIKKGLLMLSTKEGYNFLNGNWKGQGSCQPGTLWVSRLAPVPVVVELPAEVKSKEELAKEQPAEDPKESPSLSTSLIPIEVEATNTFQGRITTERQPPVGIKNTVLIIEIWDHKEIDGDIISLYLNEELILDNYTLKEHHHQLEITIDKSKANYLMLYAHNLGEVPPNTAAISIDDGVEKQLRILRSDLAQSEIIQLDYIEE